jgi:hypothetical protein
LSASKNHHWHCSIQEIRFALRDHAQGEGGLVDVVAVVFPDFAEGLDADGKLPARHGRLTDERKILDYSARVHALKCLIDATNERYDMRFVEEGGGKSWVFYLPAGSKSCNVLTLVFGSSIIFLALLCRAIPSRRPRFGHPGILSADRT